MPRRDDAKLLAMVAEARNLVAMWKGAAVKHRKDADVLCIRAAECEAAARELERLCDKAVEASEKRPVKRSKEGGK